MIARELLSNKKLEEISYFNGYSNFTVYYSGGGIYCFTAKMDEGLWINGDTDGIVYFSDEEPTDEEFGNPEWQVAHNVVEELTEEEYKGWAYSALNFFIDIYKENGSDDDLICHANIDIDELKKIVNKMYSPKTNQPEMTIVQTIDIGGPVDAYVNYFWELASIDRYAMSDTDECPIHASEMAANIAKISEKLWKRVDDETENTFYVAIYRDRQNDPLWFVVDNLSDVKVTDDYKVDRIYRLSGDTYEPDLYIVKPSHREEIETNYCESADMTYIMKTTYDGNQVTSLECIGWYCGEPNYNATEFYGSKGCLKATYNN